MIERIDILLKKRIRTHVSWNIFTGYISTSLNINICTIDFSLWMSFTAKVKCNWIANKLKCVEMKVWYKMSGSSFKVIRALL